MMLVARVRDDTWLEYACQTARPLAISSRHCLSNHSSFFSHSVFISALRCLSSSSSRCAHEDDDKALDDVDKTLDDDEASVGAFCFSLADAAAEGSAGTLGVHEDDDKASDAAAEGSAGTFGESLSAEFADHFS